MIPKPVPGRFRDDGEDALMGGVLSDQTPRDARQVSRGGPKSGATQARTRSSCTGFLALWTHVFSRSCPQSKGRGVLGIMPPFSYTHASENDGPVKKNVLGFGILKAGTTVVTVVVARYPNHTFLGLAQLSKLLCDTIWLLWPSLV